MSRVLMILLIVGCSAPAIAPPDASPIADGAVDRLILGTAALDGQGFLPLQGDQLLVAGIQGGYHVWLKLRVAGFRPGPASVHRTVHRADGAPILDAETTVEIGAATDGYWQQPSPLPLFLCPAPGGVAVVDQTVRADIAVTSAAATADRLTASATFTVHCPDDSRAACLQLCSG